MINRIEVSPSRQAKCHACGIRILRKHYRGVGETGFFAGHKTYSYFCWVCSKKMMKEEMKRIKKMLRINGKRTRHNSVENTPAIKVKRKYHKLYDLTCRSCGVRLSKKIHNNYCWKCRKKKLKQKPQSFLRRLFGF